MKLKNIFPLITILISLCACSNNSSSSNKDAQQINRPVTDEKVVGLFQSKCAVCHGADGTAGIANAANLKISQLDSGSVVKIVTDGKGAMPSFKSQLNELEISKIAAYVRSLR